MIWLAILPLGYLIVARRLWMVQQDLIYLPGTAPWWQEVLQFLDQPA